MRSLAVISEKGGTGKTTTVLNVAGELSRLGHRVLVVDADPQGNASMVLLGGEKPTSPTLAHVLGGLAGVRDAIRSTRFERLSLLPGDALLADVALQLAGELGRERRLRLALEEVAGDFDYIVCDSPAGIETGALMAMHFADEARLATMAVAVRACVCAPFII